MSPQGATLEHKLINRMSADIADFILVCGRYEGVDERFIEKCVDLEISIGNYVVSVSSLLWFLLTRCRVNYRVFYESDSSCSETYVEGLFDYPHYTRPETISNMECRLSF